MIKINLRGVCDTTWNFFYDPRQSIMFEQEMRFRYSELQVWVTLKVGSRLLTFVCDFHFGCPVVGNALFLLVSVWRRVRRRGSSLEVRLRSAKVSQPASRDQQGSWDRCNSQFAPVDRAPLF